MKLKLRPYIKPRYIILAVVVLVLAVFFIRTALWENAYYHAKEGSTRAVAEVASDTDTTALIETPPTETEVVTYEVAEGFPRYITVDSLGVKQSRVLHVGLTSSGAIATPINIYDAAWYSGSALPGSGGTVVINGHNGANQKGIFKELGRLPVGATIEVEVGGGSTYAYRVVENVAVPLADADDYMSIALTTPTPGTESLTLISCSGKWLSEQNTYDHRQFVRAVRI